MTNTGRYNCCPYSNAVCCSDYYHCCPYGYTCNLPYCTNSQQTTQEMSALTPASYRERGILDDVVNDEIVTMHGDAFVDAVTCDSSETCPSGSTCCQKPTGDFACCSFPGASCCGDGIHCCPEGFTCDLQKRTCLKDNVALFIMEVKKPARRRLPGKNIPGAKCLNADGKDRTESAGLKCPDGDTTCEDTSTCCKSANENYHCCKFQDAVCCSDGKHCCPKGFTCSGGGMCFLLLFIVL